MTKEAETALRTLVAELRKKDVDDLFYQYGIAIADRIEAALRNHTR